MLVQVADQVRSSVLRRLDELCGRSLRCHIADLEAICGELLAEKPVLTNQIFRKPQNMFPKLSGIFYLHGLRGWICTMIYIY